MAGVLYWNSYQKIQFCWLFDGVSCSVHSLYFFEWIMFIESFTPVLGIPSYESCFLASNSSNVNRENIPLGTWCGECWVPGISPSPSLFPLLFSLTKLVMVTSVEGKLGDFRGVWLGHKAGLKVQGQTHSRRLININVSLLPSLFPKEFPSCGAKCYFIFWLTVGITVTLSALNIIFPDCHPISIIFPLLQTPLPFLPPPFLFLMLLFYSFPVHPHCLRFYSDVTNPTRTNPIHSKRRLNVP